MANGSSGKGPKYTTLASSMPSVKGQKGIDAWGVVGGGPTDQKTSKNGPGDAKNNGK